MNTQLFLEKYYKLLEHINDSALSDYSDFYVKVYEDFFTHMAEYCNFITEYSDETSGVRAIQAMHRLVKKLELPVKEFKVPSLSLHIFYRVDI